MRTETDDPPRTVRALLVEAPDETRRVFDDEVADPDGVVVSVGSAP